MVLTEEQREYYRKHLKCPICKEPVGWENRPNVFDHEDLSRLRAHVFCNSNNCGWDALEYYKIESVEFFED